MNVKTTLSISEARKKIFQIAKKVQEPSMYYTLTENGRPKAVILSAEEFESWMETLEVAKDFPRLNKEIIQTKKDLRSGKYKTYKTLEDILAKEGYITTKKVNKYYGISGTSQAKRRKRPEKTSRKR